MRRTMLTLATLSTLALVMALPAGALAATSSAFNGLDGKISSAWSNGKLTRGEINDIRDLQQYADRVIADAHRDGIVTRAESQRIDQATDAAVDTFRRYRDNRSVRTVRVAVRPIVPAPVVAIRTVARHSHHHAKVVVKPGRVKVRIR